MTAPREIAAFALVLGGLVAGFFAETLLGGKVLSPVDVLFVSAAFREGHGESYEPANRLLMDPVLQFEPWLAFNRAMLRRGRLPLWNGFAGCGTPHLANGQSAVFDPFHLIAYLGPLPEAHARMAAARLWVAGLGMFLLARAWGLGAWGRWFAGLAYPFCGFLVVWLLYPVTGVAVWMPWLFLATDRVVERPDARGLGLLGLAVGCVFVGGHIQTSAHVLLASGAYTAWRVAAAYRRGEAARGPGRAVAAWSAGVCLGLAVASVSIVPLWFYLGKSPVWSDRERERPSPWGLTRPRLPDAVCTAVPYAFGSQRRGHPNLARAVGVHNVNESAGGFAGLATLAWLVPQAWRSRRANPRVVFLAGLGAFGFLGAFGVAPVVNVLRAVPVVNVTDHRRLTLWVAFASVLLGGVGLDRLGDAWTPRASRWWLSAGAVGAAALALGAAIVPFAEPRLRARAEAHYALAAGRTEGADPAAYRARAERQVEQTLRHLPRVFWLTAAELAALGTVAVLAHRNTLPWAGVRFGLLGLTVVELFAFGYGLNPAVDRRDARPVSPAVAYLQHEVGGRGRVVGLGEELLPNVAMRYGLSDPRNYDSVELARSVRWLSPLYEAVRAAAPSRRTVTWAGVARARERLREAGVVAAVASTPPPQGLAARVDRVGRVWVARLDAEPLVTAAAGDPAPVATLDHGRVGVSLTCSQPCRLIVRETFDPGWRAEVDGRPAAVETHRGTFLSVGLRPGSHKILLVYDPPEVRAACSVALAALAASVFAVSGLGPARSPRFPRSGLGRLRTAGVESVL